MLPHRDIVQVAAGTYNENIDFNGRAIVVMSECGPTETTIHGIGTGNVVLGATGSTLEGFTITGSEDTSVNAMLATMMIRENIITGNSIGIFTANYREPLIVNNLIHNNSHNGIDAEYYSSPIIINNTIAFNGNHGIFSASATGLVMNNIIFSNESYGIFCTMPESSPEIIYNDVFGNQLGEYSGYEPGGGNIYVSPMFVDAINADYHLRDYSPCISAGFITLDMPDTDIEGNPRPNPPGSMPGIGTYENSLGENLMRIFVSKKRLVFEAAPGKEARPQHFRISFTGGAKIAWTVEDDAEWLTCSPASGSGNKKISVSINPSGLSPGRYKAKITLSSPGATNSPQYIEVTLRVYSYGPRLK